MEKTSLGSILPLNAGWSDIGSWQALWESEEKMANARPQMIGLLDSARHLLEELSPELGVTDPVSGTVVFEKHIS